LSTTTTKRPACRHGAQYEAKVFRFDKEKNVMNSKLVVALIVCGTLCILATLGISAYLMKQLSPTLASDGRIHDNHILLVFVASVPGVATFVVGITLLAIGLKRSVGRGDIKDSQ
jgi:hypothetical protein